MTDRDRLIELQIKAYKEWQANTNMETSVAEFVADYLLANGVIVPPCYIGQEIWYLCEHYDGSVEIEKGKISMLQQKVDKSWKFRITINSSVWDFKVDDIGVRYFLTKEEAEAEREGKKMTNKEMLEMRINGATFQEIADICGISKQDAHERINRYFKKVVNSKRGKNFTCDEIIYEGIYEHFMRDENESVTSFAVKVFGCNGSRASTTRNFITGKNETHFTINQIKKMCEIVGKPFEEVFKEREG